jgi:hypothetical protein
MFLVESERKSWILCHPAVTLPLSFYCHLTIQVFTKFRMCQCFFFAKTLAGCANVACGHSLELKSQKVSDTLDGYKYQKRDCHADEAWSKAK